MAEYIDKAEALDALRDEMAGTGYQSRAMMAIERIHPVEVVRCKDCKYYHPRQFDYDGCFFGAVPVYREPEDFCSDGKPREVENNV